MVQWTHTSRVVDVDFEVDGTDLFRSAPATIMKTIIDSISDGIIILRSLKNNRTFIFELNLIA